MYSPQYAQKSTSEEEKMGMVSPFDIKIKPYQPDMLDPNPPKFGGSNYSSEIRPTSVEMQYGKPMSGGSEQGRLITFSEEPPFSETTTIEDVKFVDRYDILTLQKKYNSLQMCLCCKKDNRFTIFPYDKFGNPTSTPIFETIEHVEPLSTCCASHDCRSLYMTTHEVKPDFTINEATYLTFHKDSTFHCCGVCEEFYRVNVHFGEKVINLGKINIASCNLIPTYEVFDSENVHQFTVKGMAKNLFVFPLLGCQSFRRMSFQVISPEGRLLTNLEHAKDSLTIMFPPKFTKIQKNLLACAATIIFQRHI